MRPEEGVPRLIDVGNFSADAIYLENFEIRTPLKCFNARNFEIIATNIETFEPPADLIDRLPKCFGLEIASIRNQGAPAVIGDLAQKNDLSDRRNAIGLFPVLAEKHAGHSQGAGMVKDELLHRGVSISRHGGEPLPSDRKEVSPIAARQAVVEHAEFEARDVFLRDDRFPAFPEVEGGLSFRMDYEDALSALANIGFEDNGV